MSVNWPLYTLDELGSVNRGRSRHRPRNAPHLYGGKYPFIQTADVKASNLYITEYTQTYSEEGLSQSKLWQPGTLCITIAANIAETGILAIPACFPDSVIGFIPYPNKADARYIKYYFDLFQRTFQQISQGATQDNLSAEKLLSLKIPAPPLSTQKKIAGILSAYDDLIENNLRRIKLLEELAQITYEEWFVRFRFPGHESTPINPTTNLPEGWEKKPLSSLGEYMNGYAFKPDDLGDEGFPVIKIKEIKAGVVADTPRNLGENIPNKYITKAGDIIFSWSATLEVVIWQYETGLINQHLFKVTPNSNIPKSFLYLSLKAALKIFDGLTTGATMKHIKRKELDFVETVFPSVEILNQFGKFADTVLSEILNLSKQTQQLREARDILLPRLMTGMIDVDQYHPENLIKDVA